MMVLPLFLGYDAYILFYGFTYQMVSDYSRRDASANRTEKLKIINSLAEYYVKQGLKIHISDEKDGIGYGVPPARAKNEVLDAVIKALDLYILIYTSIYQSKCNSKKILI